MFEIPYLRTRSARSPTREETKASPDHGWSLERETPAVHSHISRKTHRLQHLRPEHARVSNLDPSLEALVPGEDLERRLRGGKGSGAASGEDWSRKYLGVGVVGRLEAEICDAHLGEEDLHESCSRGQHGAREDESAGDSPIKSASVRFRSATTPSTWWNSARWVASTASFLKTRSILKSLAGLNPPGWFAIS